MPATLGADDLYRFRWIDHVRLSRDGERIAYQLSWADAESRQTRSRIVIRRLLDQEPVDATALFGMGAVADSLPQKYLGSENDCPIKDEPTTSLLRVTRLPEAEFAKASFPIPITTKG